MELTTAPHLMIIPRISWRLDIFSNLKCYLNLKLKVISFQSSLLIPTQRTNNNTLWGAVLMVLSWWFVCQADLEECLLFQNHFPKFIFQNSCCSGIFQILSNFFQHPHFICNFDRNLIFHQSSKGKVLLAGWTDLWKF